MLKANKLSGSSVKQDKGLASIKTIGTAGTNHQSIPLKALQTSKVLGGSQSAIPPHLIAAHQYLNLPAGPTVVKTSGWFNLPGEIRNYIYDLTTEESQFQIYWLSRRHKSLTYRKVKEGKMSFTWTTKLHDQHWRDYCDTPDLDKKAVLERRRVSTLRHRRHHDPTGTVNPHGPAAWLLTCRQMYEEGTHFFYSKCTFAFCHQGPLLQFVSQLTPSAVSAIQKIHLEHRTFGEPHSTKFLYLQESHHLAWKKACEVASQKLTGLKSLSLRLILKENPIDLTAEAEWIPPLLTFATSHLAQFDFELVTYDGATNCGQKLEKKHVRSAVEHTRREVLGEKYQKPQRPPRATKTLRIRM